MMLAGPVRVRLLAHRFPESTIILYFPDQLLCLLTSVRKMEGTSAKIQPELVAIRTPIKYEIRTQLFLDVLQAA